MARIVALLDSMWGWGGYNEAGEEAPRYFRINPDNLSGRRLYRLCGDHELLVTNSCRMVQRHANAHGEPDIEWVRANLIKTSAEMDLLLVCGRIARQTFEIAASVSSLEGVADGRAYLGAGHVFSYYVIDHPAARRWSNEKMEITKTHIERLLCQN